MARALHRLSVKNYRCLADVEIDLGHVNVFFGPNGSGKSSLLDTLWFLRDCAIRGVGEAASSRSHGIGLRWEGAEDGAPIVVGLSNGEASYSVEFALSSGRIDPLVGERFSLATPEAWSLQRTSGTDRVTVAGGRPEDRPPALPLLYVEPEKPMALAVGRALGWAAASQMGDLLRSIRSYHARSAYFYRLRQQGSNAGAELRLQDRAENLWSVLRNLHDRTQSRDAYGIIMQFMRESFPDFQGLEFEQTGPSSVYAAMLDRRRARPIFASGISDGHLQQLMLLTAMFAEPTPTILLLDEPELSLHPHALKVLAEALRVASAQFGRQVLLATHSPPLLSQFEARDCFAALMDAEGATHFRRISELEGVQDLLNEYAAGSLYMAELLAPQSAPK